MYDYHFRVAGLLIHVISPFPIHEFYELSNYISECESHEQPDAVYTLDYLPQDWSIRGTAILKDRQNAIYEYQGDEHRYFFWNVHSQEYYVLLSHRLDDPSQYTIYLQRDTLDRVMAHFHLSAFLSPERLLLRHEAFLLHASVIDWQGNGILFSAPSGTGKSTQAALWEQTEGADILNGDRALIRRQNGKFRVYGSPYAGTSGVHTNRSVPIRAIVVLSQAKTNILTKINSLKAFTQLYREATVYSWDPDFVSSLSFLIQDLVDQIPIYSLACLPDRSAVEILKNELLTHKSL